MDPKIQIDEKELKKKLTPEAVSYFTRNRNDSSYGLNRTEVVCARCNSHLGHVFDSGSAGTGRQFCINGACLLLNPSKDSLNDKSSRS